MRSHLSKQDDQIVQEFTRNLSTSALIIPLGYYHSEGCERRVAGVCHRQLHHHY